MLNFIFIVFFNLLKSIHVKEISCSCFAALHMDIIVLVLVPRMWDGMRDQRNSASTFLLFQNLIFTTEKKGMRVELYPPSLILREGGYIGLINQADG